MSHRGRFVASVGVAALLVPGCTAPGPGEPDRGPSTSVRHTGKPTSPEDKARRELQTALGFLADSPGVHYKGALTIGASTETVDLRVSRNGVAHGWMADGRVGVLALKDMLFMRADTRFWLTALNATGSRTKTEQARMYSNRWVKTDPADLFDPGRLLRPSALAAQFGDNLRRAGIGHVARARTHGVAVTVIPVGLTRFHVARQQPHRLVKVENPRLQLPDRASRSAVRSFGSDPRPTNTPTDDPSPSSGSDDSLSLEDIDLDGITDFYNQVKAETEKNLRKAIDAQIQFNVAGTGNLACPQGACTVVMNVSNHVAQGPDVQTVTGKVSGIMRAIVTGPIGTQACTDSKTVPVNGSTTMSCQAVLALPPCTQRICYHRFTANAVVTARASLNITALLRDLDSLGRRDKEAAKCPSANSFTRGTKVRMGNGANVPIEQVDVGQRVLSGTPRAGTVHPAMVTDVTSSRGRHELVRITVDIDGAAGMRTGSVIATTGHPFWRPDARRWVHAGDLQSGHRVSAADGTSLEVVRVRRYQAYVRVFNLSVKGLHTYYVQFGSVPVLTHNESSRRTPWCIAQPHQRADLPSWRRITVNMTKVRSAHTTSGDRFKQSGKKNPWPDEMTAPQIERAIKQAYRNGYKSGAVKGRTVRIRGEADRMLIEMYINLDTKQVGTAYPIVIR